MSDLRIQSSALMCIDPSVEDPDNAMSRADESVSTGARGRSGNSDGGTSSVSTAPADREGTGCLSATLNAVGTCGGAAIVVAGTGGAGAVFAGMVCAAATMALLDCEARESASRSQNVR